MIGENYQSILQNSSYYNNTFSNFNSFNFCIAILGFGSNVSGCIEEFQTLPPPSTLAPSTPPPSTLTPSTQISSTQFQSTQPQSTPTIFSQPPSTQMASTQTILSTQTASNVPCYYNVPNCINCENGNTTVQVDPNLFNISCIFVSKKWIYSFKNKTSNTITLSKGDLVFQQQTNIYFDGNFDQDSSSKLSFSISQQNNNDDGDSVIVVNGCVSLNGSIELLLNERPSNNEDIQVNLISYNCSTLLTLSESQVRLETNYPNNQCDSVSRKISNRPNSLSVSISSTLNINCGIEEKFLIFIFTLKTFYFLIYLFFYFIF